MESRVDLEITSDYVVFRLTLIEVKELRLTFDQVRKIVKGIEDKTLDIDSVKADESWLLIEFVMYLLRSREAFEKLKTWIRQQRDRAVMDAYFKLKALQRQRRLEIEAMRDR